MLWVCRKVKEKYTVPIRLNTNGQVNLIYGDDMTPLFDGAVDIVSVSLNTANAAEYDRICHSDYGEDAYPALIDFARRVRPFVKQVILTVVRTTISESDIELCRKIADENGVELRVRELI
jgi:TatD family-associated radical SAM protein